MFHLNNSSNTFQHGEASTSITIVISSAWVRAHATAKTVFNWILQKVCLIFEIKKSCKKKLNWVWFGSNGFAIWNILFSEIMWTKWYSYHMQRSTETMMATPKWWAMLLLIWVKHLNFFCCVNAYFIFE